MTILFALSRVVYYNTYGMFVKLGWPALCLDSRLGSAASAFLFGNMTEKAGPVASAQRLRGVASSRAKRFNRLQDEHL